MDVNKQLTRTERCCKVLSVGLEIGRYFSTLVIAACVVLIAISHYSRTQPRECASGEKIQGCICARSILEDSIEYCRDLNKEEDCHEESKVYSYPIKTCMDCAEDQLFDREQGKCVGCPEGLVLYGNICVTPKDMCNSQGEMYNGSECVACAADHKLIGNECVKITISTPAAQKKNSHMAIIIGIALAVVAVLAVVIVVFVVQRRKNQEQFVELKGIDPSAQGGEGQIENTLALNYKFDE